MGRSFSRWGRMLSRISTYVYATNVATRMSATPSTSAMPSSKEKPPREPLPKGFMVLWTTVLIDLIGFGVAIPVLGPFARKEFGATGLQVGILGAAFSLAQFVVARPIGKLSDRIGRKPVLVVSLIGTTIASIATGLAGSLWLLVAARAFDGASGATVAVAQASVADVAPPHRRSQLLGMLGAAFGIGFTVGPAIGGLASWLGSMVSDDFGRRAPFFVAALIAGTNAIAAIIRLPETRPVGASAVANGSADAAAGVAAGPDAGSAGAGVADRLATTWRENSLPRLLAVAVLTMFAFSAFEHTFSIYGQERIGFTQTTASIAFVIVGVVISVVQGGLIRPVTAKFGDRTPLQVGLILTGIGLAVLATATSWAVLVPAIVLLSVGQGFASPTMSATITNRIAPEKRGEVLGVQQSWSALARVLGPLSGGWAFDHIGVSAPLVGGAVVFAFAAILLLTVPGNKNRAFARS